MKKVVWTNVAINSLQLISDSINEQWNESVTSEFLNKLDHRISQIQRNPKLAPTFKRSTVRQLFIHNNVSLFYRIHPDYIKLLLIWDNRQNPELLYKKLTSL